MADRKRGRVTIPTDIDVVPQTLELLDRWGDCPKTRII